MTFEEFDQIPNPPGGRVTTYKSSPKNPLFFGGALSVDEVFV